MSSPPSSPHFHDQQHRALQHSLAVFYCCDTGTPLYTAVLWGRFLDLFAALDWFPPPLPGERRDRLQVFTQLVPRLQCYEPYDLNPAYLGRIQSSIDRRPKWERPLEPNSPATAHDPSEWLLGVITMHDMEASFRASLADKPVLDDLFLTWVANAPYSNKGWKRAFASKHNKEPSWTTRRLAELEPRLERFLLDAFGSKRVIPNEVFIKALHRVLCDDDDERQASWDEEPPPVAPPAPADPAGETDDSDEPTVAADLSLPHPNVSCFRDLIRSCVPGGPAFLAVVQAAATWADLEKAYPNEGQRLALLDTICGLLKHGFGGRDNEREM